MSLTSWWLTGLAAAGALAALVTTLRAWPLLAAPRRAYLLARAGLLVWTQVAVVLLIFLSVNDSAVFFASWSDLFGTNNTTGVVVPGPHDSGGQPSPIQPQGTGRLATPPGVPSPAGAAWRGRAQLGEVQVVHVRGQRSGLAATAYVYLPPQYFRPGGAGDSFPVILAITSHVTTAGDPYSAASLTATAAGEIAAGRAGPAIIVILPVAVAGPGDLGCLDVPAGPQAATFFSQDLPAAIEAAYPASHLAAGWAVLGDAAGGYCALWLAMAHSDRFALAAAPLAGYGLPPGAATGGGWLFGGSAALRDECDLRWRLWHWPPQPIDVLFLRGPAAPTPDGGADAAGARLFFGLAAPPMRVGEVALTTGPQPLAPALDRISAALAPADLKALWH